MSIEARLQELREIADQHAKAAAEAEYIREYRKALKANLMKQAEVGGHKTTAAQEREAYAHEDYAELLQGLKVAVEEATRLRWHLEIARMGAEVWRTKQANQRAERKGYGA